MHTAYNALLAFAALQFSAALPSPKADRPPPPSPPQYFVDSQSGPEDGPPFVGGTSVEQNGVVGISQQYAVAYSTQVGANLGLNVDDIIGAGVSISVAKTTETAIAESAQYECPDGAWTCALKITPSVVHVKGHMIKYSLYSSTKGDYEVTIPRTDSNGNAVVKVTVCACKNRKGWADAGAPPLCPSDCN